MDENWYTNKELFEQINNVSKDFTEMRAEMRETRMMIKQYNGLREKFDEVEKRQNHIESVVEGRKQVGTTIKEWGGWAVGIAALIARLFGF